MISRALLIALSVLCAQVLIAQDILVKKTGDEIEVKVLEIGLEVVKYKTHDNLDGPTISIKIDDLFMIKYANGTKHVFKDEEEKKPDTSDDDNSSSVTYTKRSDAGMTVTYSKLEYQRKVSDVSIYHALKVAPLLIFNGEIPIFYERRLGEHTSVEIGIGITTEDFFYDGISGEFNTYETRETRTGYTIAGSFRFYPSKYTMAMDEMYFGPSVRYKHYNTTFTSCDGTPYDYPESREIIDFQLSGGYVYWVTDRVMFDVYGGIGMRTKIIEQAYCDVSGPITVALPPSATKDTGPAVTIGFKFGFGF